MKTREQLERLRKFPHRYIILTNWILNSDLGVAYDQRKGLFEAALGRIPEESDLEAKLDETLPENIKRGKIHIARTSEEVSKALGFDVGDLKTYNNGFLDPNPSYGKRFTNFIGNLKRVIDHERAMWQDDRAMDVENRKALGKTSPDAVLALFPGSDTNRFATYGDMQKYINENNGRSLVFGYDDYAPVRNEAAELTNTLLTVKERSGAKIYLIGHSHGGVIIQKIMQNLYKIGEKDAVEKAFGISTIWYGIKPKRDTSLLMEIIQGQHLPDNDLWEELRNNDEYMEKMVNISTRRDWFVRGPMTYAPGIPTVVADTGHFGIRCKEFANLFMDIAYGPEFRKEVGS